jgi:hypothetical protein
MKTPALQPRRDGRVRWSAWLGHASLAKLIKSSRGWVKRALRGDAPAKSVRHRIAAALSLEDATKLGLAFEWQVEDRKREMRRDIEATLTAEQPARKRYVTSGVGMWMTGGKWPNVQAQAQPPERKKDNQ